MKQMILPEGLLVRIDFSLPGIPESVKTFQPLVFHDGTGYCCLLGPDPQEEVIGCGATVSGALIDWEYQLFQRLDHQYRDDEFAQYVAESLKASVDMIN